METEGSDGIMTTAKQLLLGVVVTVVVLVAVFGSAILYERAEDAAIKENVRFRLDAYHKAVAALGELRNCNGELAKPVWQGGVDPAVKVQAVHDYVYRSGKDETTAWQDLVATEAELQACAVRCRDKLSLAK